MLVVATKMIRVNLKPEDITDAAIRTNNLHAGIMLLEEALAGNVGLASVRVGANPRKRVKQEMAQNESIQSQIQWELARLYEIMGDHDVTLIMYEKVAKHPNTIEGINAFLNMDYQKAFQKFIEANDGDDKKEYDKIEVRLWTDEAIRCYKKLTMWDEIYNQTLGDLDNDPFKAFEDLEK